MQTLIGKHWHHLPAEEAVTLLGADAARGLDLFEVRRRQERFGPNSLTPPKGKSPLLRFLLQFHNPLIYILLAAAAVTAVVKAELVDAAVILAVALVNGIIGFVQEARAERAIEALAGALTSEASVLRSGETLRLPASQLVPGDVVVLKSGDRVPADLRLLRTRDLQVAEAALTGESLPVEKDAGAALPEETVLADRRNMAFTSSLVTFGQGSGVVVATGDSTQIGQISRLISSAQPLATPLTRKMAAFSRVLMFVILGLAAVTFGIGLLRGQPPVDTFTAAIALAVAAIPEGLPTALTVTLAIGVSRMAARRAIIRKLPAVETLGAVTVIASDKTGTLTRNEMTVQTILAGDRVYRVTGSGYQPQGELLDERGAPVDLSSEPALREVLLAGLLVNDSRLVQADDAWRAEGDPTEVALLTAARKAAVAGAGLQRLDEIPFDSQHQYMATLHRAPDGRHVVWMKGAVEAILPRCSQAAGPDGQPLPMDERAVHARVEELAAGGLRVLAFARRELSEWDNRLDENEMESGFTFLGLQAMIDPPRPEAITAIQACRSAGIQVKMITGDHAATAEAIAREFGLLDQPSPEAGLPAVMTGRELAQASDADLIRLAAGVHVFARVTPEQKLRLVEALQARGQVVAMTGDGVNDGPALKQSDVGIAMGITGTEVAREAADMVLTDDNFATIEAAVEEGRTIYDNLTKIIAWTLPTNLGEGLIILAAVLLGITLPILPVQILWINMATVIVLGLVLAMERREPDVMQRAPRDPARPILTRTLLWRIVLVGILILLGSFGLFELQLAGGASLEAARTVAVNMVVMIQMFYVFNTRSLSAPVFRLGLFSSPWAVGGFLLMLALQLGFTYLPFMNAVFHTAPVPAVTWLEIAGFGLLVFLLVEAEKALVQRWQRRRAGAGSGRPSLPLPSDTA